ncbi:hypothetical protein [Achromobacter ruhlandii]|uniref:hypothetical protein n=1 Tax=Achromobacter ruhlandii TaxID=72557 RepID=UPI001582162B|nr:hypothetical protein [Achromobacter ruhlandii]
MNTARDKYTLDLVEAEELWALLKVDQDRYICRGCGVGVFPASYVKGINRKRPYFTLGPVNKHAPECNVDGDEKIINRAKTGRIGQSEGFPVPFPSKLLLSDERPVVSGGGAKYGNPLVGSKSRSMGGCAPSRHHGHTVKTIRPACRTYINFPYDRASLPLSVPDVHGKTYAEIFWYLASRRPSHFKNPKHLYFAAIRWRVEPVLTDACCVLTLNVGDWIEEKKEHASLSRVHVDWSGWSQSRRDVLIREFETAREEAAERAKKNSREKGWLFFVGRQDSTNPEIFHVDDHRLICCLAAELVWPRV